MSYIQMSGRWMRTNMTEPLFKETYISEHGTCAILLKPLTIEELEDVYSNVRQYQQSLYMDRWNDLIERVGSNTDHPEWVEFLSFTAECNGKWMPLYRLLRDRLTYEVANRIPWKSKTTLRLVINGRVYWYVASYESDSVPWKPVHVDGDSILEIAWNK